MAELATRGVGSVVKLRGIFILPLIAELATRGVGSVVKLRGIFILPVGAAILGEL